MGMKWKNQYDLWEHGYVKRNSNYGDAGTLLNGEEVTMKDLFDTYEYSVEIMIDDSATIKEMYAAEHFCKEHFGELNEHTANSKWQVCSAYDIKHDPPGPSFQLSKLIFLFHNADDAMAFKLGWS